MTYIIICTILSIVGVFGFFSGNFILVIIGGLSGIAENLIGIKMGRQNSLVTASIAIVLGVIYTFHTKMPIWKGILIGMSFETAIMGLLGLETWLVSAVIKGLAGKK